MLNEKFANEERTNNQYLFFDASDSLDQNRNKFGIFFSSIIMYYGK